MGTELENMGGLSSGDIQLMVLKSENNIRSEVESRLAEQDVKIDVMQTDVSMLLGTAKLTGWVQETKKAVDRLSDNSMQWHQDDLDYRSEIKDRMTSIESYTSILTEQVSSIKWIVKANNALSWSIRKSMSILKEADIWKLLIVGCIIWLTGHYSPALYHWFIEVIKATK